ncbi:hypothetical protein AAZX31_14G150700 [Glycine max]
MDHEVLHQAPPSPIHLDRFHHQRPPTKDPNLSKEDMARIQFPVDFLFENAYNIQRRLDMEFQPSIDWTQMQLDVEEEVITCPSSIHKVDEVVPSSSALYQPIEVEILPPSTWKRIHSKVSKPASLVTLCKNVYKIPFRACKELVSYDKDIIGWSQKIDTQTDSNVDMDHEVLHQAPPSPIHLDRFHHQGPPTKDPNLSKEDMARIQFPVDFLFENAYKIQRRLDVEFQPSIDWTQMPLDIEEEVITCPSSIHKVDEVVPLSSALYQPIGVEILSPSTWKQIHFKVSKPVSLVTLCKNVYKIPFRACKELVNYDKEIIGWSQKIDAQHIDPSSYDLLPPFLHPKHVQLFTPMSQFVPLVYGHQVIPLTKDHIFNVGMIMMQCSLTDQWPSYPPVIHIFPIIAIKFMPDRIALRLPPLDLKKKREGSSPQQTHA